MTRNHLLAVKLPGVSVNPIKEELPPPEVEEGAQLDPFQLNTSLFAGALLETLARSARSLGIVGLLDKLL